MLRKSLSVSGFCTRTVGRSCHPAAFSTVAASDGRTVAVVGAGQMGTGIAIVAAQRATCTVQIFDTSSEQLSSSQTFIEKHLQRSIDKGRMEADERDAVLARITTTNQLADLGSADFLIEAATENVDLKLQIFEQLDGLAKPGAILATNTSSISITKIAAATTRPENVVGMHFMNPVPVRCAISSVLVVAALTLGRLHYSCR